MREVDHVLSYLSRTASMGLTYTREHAKLVGFADASWETRTSTSGWVITWQSAAISWGSRKQKSIALSTCEVEIIALSEVAKRQGCDLLAQAREGARRSRGPPHSAVHRQQERTRRLLQS